MTNSLSDWINDRTGYRDALKSILEEPIQGGARVRYVFGAALSTTFLLQLATGLLLMLSYSPSSSTAWGSVFYINEKMTLGWVIRGLHHFGSGAMMSLLALHLIQVVAAGAYRRPREANWWFGMGLMFLVLGFSLTGYLLPWDQKGFWATRVATGIMGGVPVLGPYIQKIVIGGPDYGNQTITRFYGLHVGLLPVLTFLTLTAHIALARRHGLTPARNSEHLPVGKNWPEQFFMNAVAGALVFGILLTIVLSQHGANLDAPADPSSSDYPARPEWYFLSLFQLLKVFPGRLEMIATVVIPASIVTVLALLPLLDRIFPRRLAHFLACGFIFGLMGGVVFLSIQAVREDLADEGFQADRQRADLSRQRAIQLANDPNVGVPPDGATYVLVRDPFTHGNAVLESKCLSCHYFAGKGQILSKIDGKDVYSPQVASDLKGFGSYAWLRGMLENPKSDLYFGKAKGCDGMAEWKKSTKLTSKELDDVAKFVASFAEIGPDTTPEEWLSQPGIVDHPGYKPFTEDCGKCHVVEGLTEGGLKDSPNLFAWGSTRWIRRMIHKPGASELYGYIEEKDRMPAFTVDQLSENDTTMIIRFLKDDYVGAPNSKKAEEPTEEVAVKPVTPAK
ncbi:cytochrome b N-terminal domain-containing protein [Singulisphaera sp. PoT]|uniref:cytochrome b N-terminal domain-containing protein n=1 Tax=Singulisphaera sp. PoT TaxID=3411797 RepID=UPI003BF60FB1